MCVPAALAAGNPDNDVFILLQMALSVSLSNRMLNIAGKWSLNARAEAGGLFFFFQSTGNDTVLLKPSSSVLNGDTEYSQIHKKKFFFLVIDNTDVPYFPK